MKKLLVVWKSENEIDISKFIVPFTYNSKAQNWFSGVEVLIWGGSQVVITETPKYQEYVKTFIHNEIPVYACKMCADDTGSTEMLESLGVNVMYTGVYLAEKLNSSDWEVLTI
ncbi:hypothetical protein KQ51_01313 [Candidatus Izimaplasma bacterium HR1]|jgi:hypothetical protein|uniref:hypothetical protein n=1 Tax=Candidatus Izimoplasma sp. HR1 TaxID=1541959 RepID=UPI0004F8AB95|nr:hypothetical protein KQ51_01313 [Candidatus Izimaplasma bacterium HR1]